MATLQLHQRSRNWQRLRALRRPRRRDRSHSPADRGDLRPSLRGRRRRRHPCRALSQSRCRRCGARGRRRRRVVHGLPQRRRQHLGDVRQRHPRVRASTLPREGLVDFEPRRHSADRHPRRCARRAAEHGRVTRSTSARWIARRWRAAGACARNSTSPDRASASTSATPTSWWLWPTTPSSTASTSTTSPSSTRCPNTARTSSSSFLPSRS